MNVMGAARLAAAIRRGEVSSREVVEGFLHRVEQLNPRLNAVVQLRAEEALREAEAADAAHRRGELWGPLHGVPITIKDSLDVAGMVTTHGARSVQGTPRAETDAPVVARLRQAGAIVLGKTNLPDYGLRLHTDNDVFGPTLNPHSASHTPGGSSGGEGVAVAAGMSPLGVGTDLGGSIRLPAHCCGVFGLKPTHGLVPMTSGSDVPPPPEGFSLLATAGPLAPSVEDLALALHVMAGPHPSDPRTVPPRPWNHWQATPATRRVALVADSTGGTVSPEVRAALDEAARALEEAGCRVEETAPPGARELPDAWRTLVFIELKGLVFPHLRPLLGSKAAAYLEREVAAVPVPLDLAGYAQALQSRRRLLRRVLEWMEDYPLILAPVLNEPIPEVGFDEHPDSPHTSFRRTRNLVWPNLLGLPALAVPLGLANGIPRGVQLVGRPFREDEVLWGGAVLQQAFGYPSPYAGTQGGIPR